MVWSGLFGVSIFFFSKCKMRKQVSFGHDKVWPKKKEMCQGAEENT